MSIDKNERAQVNKVLEVLGDRATPPPRFEELEVRPPGRERTNLAVPLAVAVAVAVFAVAAIIVMPRNGGDPIRQTTIAQPTTAPLPASITPVPDQARQGFTPPRFVDSDKVMYPVALLDGTRVAVWLPASAEVDSSGYTQSAGLSSVTGDLPSVRVDVTACDDCLGEFSMQFGGWTVTASGDDLTSEVWAQYLARIKPEFTADGYLTLSGHVVLGPADAPDVRLGNEEDSMSVFIRKCTDHPADYWTEAGLAVTYIDPPDRHKVCMPEQSIEAWLPSSLTDADLELVELELLKVGPLAQLIRDTVDLPMLTGPVPIGETIVSSAASFNSGTARGYNADSYEPSWVVSTGNTTAFVLGSTDQAAIVAGHFGPVLALDSAGSTMWRLDLADGEAPAAPSFSHDAKALFLPTSYTTEGALGAPTVRSINVATGAMVWQQSLVEGTRLQAAAPTITDSLVLVADVLSYDDGAYPANSPFDVMTAQRIHALDRATGEIVWQLDLDESNTGIHDRAILTDQNTAYVTTSSATVVAVDLVTGVERWRARSGLVSDVWIPLRLVDKFIISGTSCFESTTGQPETCPPPGVFSTPTETVLVLDDGLGGVILVDLDTRTATRTSVGGAPGDQTHRLWHTADSLIAGSGTITSTVLNGFGTIPVGDATFAVPAVEDGFVWLVDYDGPRITATAPRSQLVDVSGAIATTIESDDAPAGVPQRGFAGGLIFDSAAGLVLSPVDGSEPLILGQGKGPHVGDASTQQIAWCEEQPCRTLVLTNPTTLAEVRTAPLAAPQWFDVTAARFSPDGTLVAGFIRDGNAATRLIVFDTATGDAVSNARLPEHVSSATYLSWRSNTEIYFTSHSWGQTETQLGRYEIHKSLITTTLPFGAALASIAIDAAAVDTGTAEHRTMTDCTASQECSFDF